MKTGLKNIFLSGLLFISTLFLAYSQDFTASVSKKTVAAGERFRLTYTIRNKNVERLSLPQMPDFRIVGGPYQSSQTQIVNGAYSSQSVFAYDLVASAPGDYIIGGAVLKSNGQSYTSNSVQVQVTQSANGSTQQANSGGNQPSNQTEPKTSAGKNDLFVVTSLSKSSAYPGEPVLVTYKLYSLYPQVNIEDIKYPDYKGAWINEINGSGDKAFSRENYNGKSYNVAVLQRSFFTPQHAGNMDVNPVTAKVLVQYQERSGNFWEDFFGGGRIRQERKNVSGNAGKLKVKAYPESGKPSDFNGATGSFTMEVGLDKAETAVNDALTLTLKISGSGNISMLQAPKLNLPNTFEVFDPKSSEKISVGTDGINGSKSFEYLIIPRAPGNYVLPPLRFAYFNPKTEQYSVLTSDTLKIKVTGNAAGGLVYNPAGGTENLSDDIRYIKTGFKPGSSFDGFFPGILFILLYVLFFASTVLLWIFRTKIWDLRNDTDRKKIRMADSVAIKRFKTAAVLLEAGNRSAFYEECYNAINQYLQDRLGAELSALSGQKVKNELINKNVKENLAEEAKQLLEACEMARFAPQGAATELSDFHSRCIRFISNMEAR